MNEDDDVDADRATPYGRHRRELERRAADHFDTLIVRLPGLFGDGLKKNIIYDFLHDNNVDQVDARSAYQFYWLGHLWRDIETALRASLSVLNVATEPTTVGEVAREAFGFPFTNALDRPPALYDFHSRHDRLYGGSCGYLYNKAQVLVDLRRYVASQTGARRCA